MREGRLGLRTVNDILIFAPADLVYDLAADVTAWPQLLPHYRYVTVLGGPGSTPGYRARVKMGARRSFIPVSWTSSQALRPLERRVRYHHLQGITREMDVEWRIEERDDATHVAIIHVLRSPHAWLRTRIGEYVVGRLFVEHIADRTLQGIKRQAEARVAGGVTV